MAGKVQNPELDELEIEEMEGEELSLFERYRTPLIAGGAVLVAVILGMIGWNYLQEQKNTEANAEMFKAIEKFEADSLQLAIRGDGSFMSLEDVASEYGSTAAGDQANYYLGVAYLKSDSLDDATGIDYLEKVSASGNTLAMARDIALAFGYERQDNFSKAAKLFKSAAFTPEANDNTTPYLLLEAGRCYELDGDIKAALDVYTTIKEDFPTSAEAGSIDKYIGRVSR